MSKKSILILKIILIILVVFILLIAFLWLFYNKETGSFINDRIAADKNSASLLNRNNRIDNRLNQQNGEVNTVAEFTSIAKLAAERFGSYSSDTHNFANLRDTRYLMTDKMKQWTDDFISNLLIDNSLPQEYYGVTTKALSVNIISHNKKQDAEVVVSCQKIETKGSDNPISATEYEDLRIKMLFIGEKWLIDELRWE